MSFEVYNFSKHGVKPHSFIKPIHVSSPDKWKKLRPSEYTQAEFSAHRHNEGFTLYSGDGTNGGKSLVYAKKSSKFASRTQIVIEENNQGIDMKRPQDVWPGSYTRSFNYNGSQFRWEMPFYFAHLVNCNTGKIIAEFNHRLFEPSNQGNLIIHLDNIQEKENTPYFKMILLATCFAMYLEDVLRNRGPWSLLIPS